MIWLEKNIFLVLTPMPVQARDKEHSSQLYQAIYVSAVNWRQDFDKNALKK